MLSQQEKIMVLENFKEENQPIEIINELNDGESGAAVYTVEFGESRKLGVLKIQEMNESGLHNKAFLHKTTYLLSPFTYNLVVLDYITDKVFTNL